MRATKIFISYAREDREIAQKFYHDLKALGFEPWLDEKSILGGQNWKAEIKKAIEKSSFFIALLSKNSVSKRGYVQKELRIAEDIQTEFPESQIYIIPVRLDECIPSSEKLNELQWVDLFPYYKIGLDNIIKILQHEAKNVNEVRPKPDSEIKAAKLLLQAYFEKITLKSNSISPQDILRQIENLSNFLGNDLILTRQEPSHSLLNHGKAEISINENLYSSYSYKKNAIEICAHLSTLGEPKGSCEFLFDVSGLNKCTITLSHTQILSDLITHIKSTPNIHDYKFVLFTNNGKATVRLGNNQLSLPLTDAEDLCAAISHFTNEYIKRLQGIDKAYGTRNFERARFYSEGFRLLQVPRWMWASMIDFAHEYDCENGNTDWHIFDSAPGLIKVCGYAL